MTFQERPIYWVTCDWPGCTSNAQEGSDFEGWTVLSDAHDAAEEAAFRFSKDDDAYCDSHPRLFVDDFDDEVPTMRCSHLLIDDDGFATFVLILTDPPRLMEGEQLETWLDREEATP